MLYTTLDQQALLFTTLMPTVHTQITNSNTRCYLCYLLQGEFTVPLGLQAHSGGLQGPLPRKTGFYTVVYNISCCSYYKYTPKWPLNSHSVLKKMNRNYQRIKSITMPLPLASGFFGNHWLLHWSNVILPRTVSTKT